MLDITYLRETKNVLLETFIENCEKLPPTVV